ncbi:unnamed protein product [Pedinophyceae sp. YPF-701]|nr:unnamed protein product [Pedinophyceae sp. YPF-701]
MLAARGAGKAGAGVRATMLTRAVKNVWALDFDGVLCDSCGESSLSAWKAAEALWPEVFLTEDAQANKDRVIEDMRVVRPVVETGYENIVQVRLLLEGMSAQEMLENWGTMLPEAMEKFGQERATLVELFGSTRDKWIESDLQGWLAPNRFYPGVVEPVKAALASAEDEVYIVTTKQARFTLQLLREMAGVQLEDERVFSMTVSGRPKGEVLAMLGERHPGAALHFVEDKLSTLEKVCKEVEAGGSPLEPWKLYLVDWGYNTPQERARAAANPRIATITAPEFGSLMTTSGEA